MLRSSSGGLSAGFLRRRIFDITSGTGPSDAGCAKVSSRERGRDGFRLWGGNDGKEHPHPNPLPLRERGQDHPSAAWNKGYAKVASRERGRDGFTPRRNYDSHRGRGGGMDSGSGAVMTGRNTLTLTLSHRGRGGGMDSGSGAVMTGRNTLTLTLSHRGRGEGMDSGSGAGMTEGAGGRG